MKRASIAVAALFGLLVAPLPYDLPSAQAQMRIDVQGVGATQYPIAIATFSTDGRVPQDVVAVIRSDLTRSGMFKVIDPQTTLNESANVNGADFRNRGADSVLGGSITRTADGRYEIRYRLTDVVRQTPLVAEAIIVNEPDLRLAAHRVADAVYEKVTGEKSIFSTRIAFVTKQGTRYRLNVSDWDGENVQTPLNSPEPIISPVWSPEGDRLAYVSFEARKPIVYVHTLSTGQRIVVANFKGSNSAPAWSPDGRSLAVTLSRDGSSQLYLIDARGGEARRVTSSSGIDTEPTFSPDGRSVYFTSDRGGSPQIYRVSVGGGDASRVTFGSGYNVSPRMSPDGRTLAFVTRRDGRFFVATKDLAGGGTEQVLSDGGLEESPSFAPNGRWIMYATGAGGRDALMAVSVDGRVKQRLTSSLGDIREPTWGPFSK
ncbi:MAG: Tol-Pal system beta propeller repeat protein TolB [Burkholderiaceae bacterium]